MKQMTLALIFIFGSSLFAAEDEDIIKIIKEPAKSSRSLNSFSTDADTVDSEKTKKSGRIQLVQDTGDPAAENKEEESKVTQNTDTAADAVNEVTENTAPRQTQDTVQQTRVRQAVQIPTPMSGDSVLLESGISLYNSGNYSSSIETLMELRQNFPSSLLADQANMWIAKSYLKENNVQDALAALELIPESSGEYPASLFLAGNSFLALKDYQRAQRYFYRAASLFPGHEIADDAMLELSKIYQSEGNGEEALKSAVYIMKNYSDRETADDALFMIGRIYEKDSRLKDIERARRIYTVFVERAENGMPPYSGSPLLHKVTSALNFINTNYFASE